MAPSTRTVLIASLAGVALLYYVSFWYLGSVSEKKPAIQDPHDKSVGTLGDIDAVVLLTADLSQRNFLSLLQEWYLKEKPKISDGIYSPDYPQSRGFNFLRPALRSLALYSRWFRRVVLVASDAITIPDFVNTTHPWISVVRHSEIMRADFLPSFNWRSIALHLHKIPELSPFFVLFNEFNFLVKPLNEDTFFSSDIRATKLFVASSALRDLSEVEQSIVINTRKIVEKDLEVGKLPQLEHRGPILINVDTFRQMLTRFSSAIEPTKSYRFKSSASIDPVLLYQLHLARSSLDQVSDDEVLKHISSFDTNNNGLFDQDEITSFCDSIKILAQTLPELFQYADGQPLEVAMALSSQIIRARVRTILTAPEVRCTVASSITEIVDPSERVLESLSMMLSSPPSLPVYWLGPRTLFSKYNQVRQVVDSWLFETYPQALFFERILDDWSTVFAALAIFCCVVIPFIFFLTTKILLMRTDTMHTD